MKEEVCEPKPCMWRKLSGMPRSGIRILTWYILPGEQGGWGMGGAGRGGERGNAEEGVRLLADLRKRRGGGVFGDVVGHRQGAVGGGALRMHRALGDSLAVLVREFLEQVEVLHQDGAKGTGCQRVLVVGDRRSRRRGHGRRFAHGHSPSRCWDRSLAYGSL